MKKKDLILGAGIIVIALAMLLVMQLTRGRRKSDPGYAGWENLWNVFLVEGSDHRSKGWRFL